MIDNAEGEDIDPERLAHLVLMSNVAGIHTTSMAITHAIYDLCERQEYVSVLREEIEQVLLNDGGWQRDTHNKLHKIDSFLKESQRFSPVTLCECTTLVFVRLFVLFLHQPALAWRHTGVIYDGLLRHLFCLHRPLGLLEM